VLELAEAFEAQSEEISHERTTVSELESLATVQELDTHLDQLTHRRANLPEHLALEQLAGEQADVNKALDTTSAERHLLEREQKRFEDEVGSIESKIAADNDRMYNTGITSPKELSALQDELAGLARRQEVVEDQILELMEQIEPLTTDVKSKEDRLAEIEIERGRNEAGVTVAEAEIDAEVASLVGQRNDRRAEVRESLVDRYDKLRATSRDGVVIGRMDDGRCSACGLRLSSMFIDEAKHSDNPELMQCEECGVLLVH